MVSPKTADPRHLRLRWVFLPLLAGMVNLFGGSDLGPALDKKIYDGIHAIHRDRYDLALASFKELQVDRPDHPAGYFFYGAALEWMAWDYRNYNQGKPFIDLMQKTVELSKVLVKKDPNNPWHHFYLGAGYGFLGLAHIKYGNWLQAFFDGQAGYASMLTAKKLKPDFHDVDFGLGQFHYYRSKKAAIIRIFTPQDEMKQGIQELYNAAANGDFTRIEAQNALATMLVQEGRYRESLEQVNQILAIWPENLFSYWTLVDNYVALKEYPKALAALYKIEGKLKASPFTGEMGILECNVLMADCYGHLYQTNRVEEALRKALAVPSVRIRVYPRYGELMRSISNLVPWTGAKVF